MEYGMPVSVTDVNEYIKAIMDGDGNLKKLCVLGEISNYVRHTSGHAFFTLKDAKSAIKCAFFKGYRQTSSFKPQNGMSVIAIGNVSAYPRDGIYQIYVERLIPAGEGELKNKFDALKAQLEAEGLFREDRKKPLPKYPNTVGVITSPTGAALQDIKNVLTRRFPLVNIKLYPSQVQGERAPEDLCSALKQALSDKAADVIIISRGGGAAEDLSAFNDETLTRLVAQADIPIVSGVGHETDFTLVDFAADRRAPTPSAAAELCVRDAKEVMEYIDALSRRMTAAVQYKQSAIILEHNGRKARLENLEYRLKAAANNTCESHRRSLVRLVDKLDSLSPLKVLSRGYSIVFNEDGAVAAAANVAEGDNVSIRFADGSADAVVKAVRRN